MFEDSNKENVTGGLFHLPSSKTAKKSKKTRSLSMGPGEAKASIKDDASNRRKSMMPAVKSILSAKSEKKDDEAAKRKAARRKSLANRRVSFAPEATLHTWDVIEYMKDATSSTATSDNDRHASQVPSSPAPPTQDNSASENEVAAEDEESPKQKRRSSGIPALTFDDQDDASSSSPEQDATNDDDLGDATMDLDESKSDNGGESTSSSARLDAALRQATAIAEANTQSLHFGDDGDQTMELANDEVTSAFKLFFNQKRRDIPVVRQQTIHEDQENIDPFRVLKPEQDTRDSSSDDGEDMTMDVTMAIGGIIQQQHQEITHHDQTTKSLKKRRSSVLTALVADTGSPLQRPVTRKSLSRTHSYTEEASMEDATMDFTMAVGGIREVASAVVEDDTVNGSLLDATMDFTVAVGGIHRPSNGTMIESLPDTEILEDMSMELTENLGKALAEAVIPVTPSPARNRQSPRKSMNLPTITIERGSTPRKKSPSTPNSALKALDQENETPRRSARRSPRKSIMPSTPKSLQELSEQADPVIEEDTIAETPRAIKPVPEGLPVNIVKEPSTTLQAFAPKSSISDSLKLLLTPRKEILPTPKLQPAVSRTPRKTSPKKAATPKRKNEVQGEPSPRKRVRIESSETNDVEDDENASAADDSSLVQISLPDFLKMTNIKFMDLTTTKRRATGFPGADTMIAQTTVDDEMDEEPSLENNIAAAVAVKPLLEMYQHSCGEMKSFISSGKTEIKNLEVMAMEVQPPLFHDYAQASLSERQIMDTQLRDLKANARHQSKAGWHNWRSQIMTEAKLSLDQYAEQFIEDEKILEKAESSIEKILPDLVQQEQDLEKILRTLEQRKEDQENNAGADLDEARERLISISNELKRKQELLQQLEAEGQEKASRLNDAREWKEESVSAIKEADRISEECRGWSSDEVLILSQKMQNLEVQTSWSLVSANNGSVTMKHKDLQLTIQPQSWISNTRTPSSDTPNGPISLVYMGTNDIDADTPVATVRRFFLQLLRANAHSFTQSRTHISQLFCLVKNGWQLATRILEAVHALEISSLTDVHIQGDEKFRIASNMLLAAVATKIRINFDLRVVIDPTNAQIHVSIDVNANVVYGERYDEAKMSSFLSQFVSSEGLLAGGRADTEKWAEGLDDLKDRLTKIGKKGPRRG